MEEPRKLLVVCESGCNSAFRMWPEHVAWWMKLHSIYDCREMMKYQSLIKAAELWRDNIVRGPGVMVAVDEIALEADLENKLIAAIDALRGSNASR